jgi:alpha-beta hydrolase superfamily lysophospholipase
VADSTTFPVSAPDGVTLVGRHWALPDGVTRRGAVLILHGLGEHSGRYDHVADTLLAVGLDVRSYDERGFGLSDGPRGRLPWPDAMLDDAQLMFARYEADLAALGDTRPPILLGHSMGGAVAARATTARSIRPRALVLSSPAFVPILRAAERGSLEFLSGVAPNLPLRHHISPTQLTHDPAVLADIARDPLMHNQISPRLVSAIFSAGQGALATAPDLRVPTLLQVAGRDSVVRSDASGAFAGKVPSGVATLNWYDGLFHEIYNELPLARVQVLADLQGWLKGHL